jgi:hypothetical protein
MVGSYVDCHQRFPGISIFQTHEKDSLTSLAKKELGDSVEFLFIRILSRFPVPFAQNMIATFVTMP